MFKKWLTSLIGLAVFLSFSPTTLAYEYQDVPRDSAYFYPIDYLRRNDVFKDTQNFYPELLISKAEFIKYLVILNSPDFTTSSSADLPFLDTRNNAWYASYFKEAIKLGILDDRERYAEPDKKLSMIDALTLLFHSQSIPIPNVYNGNIPYTDVERNTAAAPLIMRSMELDLVRPQKNNYVGIYQRINRAVAARMIYKLDLATLGTPTSNGLPGVENHGTDLQKLISIWELIEGSYVNKDNLDREALADGAIRGLVDQLDDPYSSYLDEEENKSFFDDIDGQIEGIGAVIGFNKDEKAAIVSPIKDGPADKAGLKAKDLILSVDDQNINGMDLMEIVSLIKGPRGTSVKLKLERENQIKTITIVRDIITVPSSEHETIEGGNIMLVNFYQFNSNAPEQFQEVVDEIGSNPHIMGMIIDLRDNPGGLLDVVVRILGHMVESNSEVVKINYADFSQTLLSRGSGDLIGFPIVVLINGGSASASEILAGALQDYDLATIVGETSFGKGTVQEVNYFEDNSSLKLTVAEWLTPDERHIQENGIEPNVWVTNSESTEEDEQLETAIVELHKLMR